MTSYNITSEISAKIHDIRAGNEIEFNLPGIVDNRLNLFSSFFFRLLNQYGISYLSEMVLVLLKEITSNCSRAAAKRIYFKENNLDISDDQEYQKGLKQFRDYITNDWEDYAAKHQECEFYIKIKVFVDDNNFSLKIENNIEMLPIELNRVKDRISSFFKYKDISEAFSSIRDESEGAGLGFFLMLSLLKNSRIPPENFKISSSNGATKHQILIPLVRTSGKLKSRFFEQVIFEINNLPSFPQNISSIVAMCQSSKSSVHIIANEIKKDPSLTAQVLRIVNSAGYMSRNKNPSLEDGVKIIGLRVLHDLLMVTGARRAIESKYKLRELEDIWEDSNKVSFFSRILAKQFNQKTIEEATIAGLLHSLGKIVLIAINPEVMKIVSELMGSSRIRNGSVVEEAMLGISNSEIGAKMAQNWNFPSQLIGAIEYQFQPYQAPEECRDVVKCIYLAICIYNATKGSLSYWHVETEILAEFGIKNEKEFDQKVKTLSEQYTQSQ